MFGLKNKKDNESVTIVTTAEQLKAAVNRKDTCIEVRGELAKKMNWMTKLSKKKIAFIIACLTGTTGVAAAAAPATGGASLAAAGAASAAVSADVMAIALILGGIVVVAILKNYDLEAGAGDMVLKLTKNK